TSPTNAATGALSAVADGSQGADLYGINDSTIAALQYALLGEDYEPGTIDPSVLVSHELVYTYTEMHGGWLLRFPEATVTDLANLQGERMVRVEKAWSPIFQEDGSPPTYAEVHKMLCQLIALAQTAMRSGMAMYWLAPGC